MNEQLMQIIKDLEIKKAPEVKSIEAANDSYTKNQLAHFIERHDLSIAKSWKKAEIVTALSEWMEEASAELLDSNAELHSFYTKDIMQSEDTLDIYEESRSESELECILQLLEHGLAYNVDGQLWTPEEAADSAVSETKESSKKTESVPAKKDTSKKKTVSSSQSKQTMHAPSRSVSPEQRVSKQKQTRLDYLKQQSKKKKRKKRK
ncbi:MAG: hypothetical protein JJU16_11475 [Alkalibacterium sp.]|nr:hypothetical protein [Alkalibacterium sp.]